MLISKPLKELQKKFIRQKTSSIGYKNFRPMTITAYDSQTETQNTHTL